MRQHSTIIILAFLCCSACTQGGTTSSPSVSHGDSANTEPYVVWAREHAVRIPTASDGFTDLQSLKSLIGQARVVALGESGHEIHEFLAFRNWLLEFLVNELGFTAIAVETGLSEGMQVDEYVQGATADDRIAARSVFHWAAPKAFEENRELIKWMRNFNAQAAPNRRIRFYGIDIPNGRPGQLIPPRQALDASLAYLDRVDSPLGQRIRSRFEPFLAKFNDQNYPTLSPEARSTFALTIAELVNVFQRRRIDFLEKTPEPEYAKAYQRAIVAQQLDAFYRNSPARTTNGQDLRDLMAVRDSAMAENVRWVLDREGPRGRVLVFAHNWHVKKAAAQKEAYPEFYPRQPTVSMGQFLHSILQDEMRVIGFTFQRGIEGFKMQGQPMAELDLDSIDAANAKVGSPLFIIDLHSAPRGGLVAEWLNQGRKIRVNDRYGELKPIEAFDALVYVDSVSGVHEIQSTPNDRE